MPSPWISRFSSILEKKTEILDLACGAGRHGRLFLDQGHSVFFVDKNLEGVEDLSSHPQATLQQTDLEDGKDWPFDDGQFGAIVVVNYLYRPHLKDMIKSLKPGGVLLYETFALGNEKFGRPRNPDFLLKPGELIELVQGQLQVVAFEHGLEGEKVVQHICAVKDDGLHVL